MALLLKKNFFKGSPVVITFFLLMMADSLSAQKKNLRIKPPEYVKLQYAGGTGFISVGAGYSSKNQKLEGDLFYGYLPESIGGVRIHSLSIKCNWIPIYVVATKKYGLEPLMIGLLINYSFGKQYFSFDPPNYPYRYYSFPTAIHSALFFGSRAGIKFPAKSFIHRLSFYYEILSFDREIISLLSNPKSLHVGDIISLSLGTRLSFE
jgi:hypothetical protein